MDRSVGASKPLREPQPKPARSARNERRIQNGKQIDIPEPDNIPPSSAASPEGGSGRTSSHAPKTEKSHSQVVKTSIRWSRKKASDASQLYRPLNNLQTIIDSIQSSKGFKSVGHLNKFLGAAIKALNVQDRDAAISAAITLGEDEHLFILRDIVEIVSIPSPNPTLSKQIRFDDHVAPFMSLLLDTFTNLSLQRQCRKFPSTINGTDGERAARLFHGAIQRLSKVNSENLYLLCRVLNSLLRCNEKVAHDELLVIYHSLNDRAKGLYSTHVGKRIRQSLQETATYLSPLSARMSIDDPKNELDKSNGVADRYGLIDGPGELSRSGKRHDNDSHAIDKIRILPTKNELRSSRPEYLPVNDASAPHFLTDGPARLFDIHFRLLREDLIGPIRDAVTFLLNNVKPAAPFPNSFASLRHSRALGGAVRLYTRVSVQSAQFHKFKGLVFRIQFQQPEQFRSLTPLHRINHWKATKSFESGSLMCLISNKPEVECFLTVANKDEKALGRHREWAYGDVIVEEKNTDALRYLLQVMSGAANDPDAFALMEFPNILLPAYRLILENLQTRWKFPYLPFSHLICHEPLSNENNYLLLREICPDPPIYTTKVNGFLFDLEPLKRQKSSSSLKLSARASTDNRDLLRKLVRETTLDEGQCRGLVAALTQELALIQGIINPN